jgi:class 3 adenylate cyclase
MSEKTIMRLNPNRNPILGNLPPEALDQMLAAAQVEKHAAGTEFIREGDPSDSVYFVTWGEVAIMKGGMEIDRQSAGGALGEMGVLTSTPRSATIVATEEIEVLKVMAEDFHAVLDSRPIVLRNLLVDQMNKVKSSQQVRVDQQTSLEQAESMLSRVVSPQVMDKVLKEKSPEELLHGTLDETAILFFDIKGFSSAAEKLPPDALLQALNDHVGIIDAAVSAQEGFIANYIGDAILAVFNWPVQIAEPGQAAMDCYIQARQALTELAEDRKAAGEVSFELGAGINFGEIVTGVMGTENRFAFTVIGDEVNLAARLEGLTRQYPVDMILSESCVRMLPASHKGMVMRMDRVQVKGRKNPENIYAMATLDKDDAENYEKGMETYLLGRFAESSLEFAKVGHPLGQYMRSRCARLQAEQLDDWPGHYSWLVK